MSKIFNHLLVIGKKLNELDSAEQPSEIFDELLRLCDDYDYRAWIVKLLPLKAVKLVKNNRAGAAGALELCGILGLSQATPAFEIALKEGSRQSLATLVAAQRIRLLNINRPGRPRYLGVFLRKHISDWLKDGKEENARNSLMSAAWLEGKECLSWLAELMEKTTSANLLMCLADAVVAVQSGMYFDPTNDEGVGRKVFEAACDRYQSINLNSQDGLVWLPFARGRLLEVMSAFNKWGAKEKVAEGIIDMYCNGTPVEKFSALCAFQHLLICKDEDALDCLIAFFNEKHPKAMSNFLHSFFDWQRRKGAAGR